MSIRLNASGENLTATLSTLTVGTGDLSFGVWVYNYSDRTTVEADMMMLADATSSPSSFLMLYADFAGILMFAGNNFAIIATGPSLSINTWYWLEWRRVSGVMHCLVFDDSSSTTPLADGTIAMATSYTTLDAIIIGAAQSVNRWPDASFANAVLQTGTSWSNAESRAQSQHFGVQKAGGTDRYCWPLENLSAGLAEYGGIGPTLTNNGGTDDSARPTQLEAFSGGGGGGGASSYSPFIVTNVGNVPIVVGPNERNPFIFVKS